MQDGDEEIQYPEGKAKWHMDRESQMKTSNQMLELTSKTIMGT